MPLYAFEGLQPQVHPSAFVAPTATLVGDVIVGSDASVWYGVVARGGLGRIIIGDGANVQDGSVLHARCEVGAGATIAHACVVHAATVGEAALVGNDAIVLDHVTIGPRCLIAAGSVVAPLGCASTAGCSYGESPLGWSVSSPATRSAGSTPTPISTWHSVAGTATGSLPRLRPATKPVDISLIINMMIVSDSVEAARNTLRPYAGVAHVRGSGMPDRTSRRAATSR